VFKIEVNAQNLKKSLQLDNETVSTFAVVCAGLLPGIWGVRSGPLETLKSTKKPSDWGCQDVVVKEDDWDDWEVVRGTSLLWPGRSTTTP